MVLHVAPDPLRVAHHRDPEGLQLIGRADASSTRLEEAVANARRSESVLSAMEQRPQERGAAEQSQPTRVAEAEVSPEAKAFLSSLSGMR